MKKAGTLAFVRDRDVLVGTVTGAVDLRRLLAIRSEQHGEWSTRLPNGTVMDYREAAFELSTRDWELAFMAGRRWTYSTSTPFCLVVNEVDVRLFRAQCDRWADLGVVAAAFTDFQSALAWASARREARLRKC